ncbi:hypothetical protein AAFX91_21825 [Bradyrhizobium sp. 31Argb]|uniref:hypothetical protein n=1 Tax=Bradyrhizobium sp. 31Argb TaxID=3141247 RepID=UPI0037499468
MSEQRELPREGGSYIRQKDGTLQRADQIAAPVTAETAPAEKPAARSTAKKAKE